MNWGVSEKFKNPSLRVRLILYCSTAIAGLWAISAITTLRYLEHHYTEQLQQFGTVVLENFIKSGKSYLVAYDYHRLRSILQESQYIGSLTYVAIYDDTGRLIAYYPSYDSPSYEQIDKFTTLSKNEKDVAVSELAVKNDRFLVLEKNVYHNGDARPVGKVRVALSQRSALAPFRSVLSRIAVFVALHLVVLLAILAWFLSRFVRPIKELAKRCAQADVLSVDSFLGIRPNAPEVAQLMHALHALSMRIVSQERELANQLVHAKLGKISSQVAHDIRSPLAALEVATAGLAELPEEKRLLVRRATARIRDIANNLIERSRSAPSPVPSELGTTPPSSNIEREMFSSCRGQEFAILRPTSGEGNVVEHAEPLSVELLSSLIDPLVTEKRLQHRAWGGVEIQSELGEESYGLFAAIQPTELKRVLSNLVNNAVEGIEGAGVVRVHLRPCEGQVCVEVTDTGKGMPAEMVAKLGQRGVTFGKEGGSGLGLFHARERVEAWGGTLAIVSEVGKGTTVTLRLPAAEPPAWFVPVLTLRDGMTVIVVDDDQSIHDIWDGRFAAVRQQLPQFTVQHFTTAEETVRWHAQQSAAPLHCLYLVDYELIGQPANGLALIEQLQIQQQAILVTSRYEEPAIRQKCAVLGVRLIPKGLAGFVPIRVQEMEDPPSQVHVPRLLLLNDDPLLRTVLVYQFGLFPSPPQITEAGTVAEALDLLARQSVDVIVADINLGEGQPNGYDFLKAVRMHHNGVPFFFCSGNSARTESAKALAAGATGYFQLPLEDGQLAVLQKALGGAEPRA
ncbi:MAG: hybrid sensor histidine kinase/response regulator [Deltaproteobacteria bacterium]|nr:hybrid sensor histidine kinase/response regulator [Deltaproteobacteria bacterium]